MATAHIDFVIEAHAIGWQCLEVGVLAVFADDVLGVDLLYPTAEHLALLVHLDRCDRCAGGYPRLLLVRHQLAAHAAIRSMTALAVWQWAAEWHGRAAAVTEHLAGCVLCARHTRELTRARALWLRQHRNTGPGTVRPAPRTG